MFAKVESAKSIRSPLLYNELKVEAKQAILLDAHNFWQEKEDLSLREKIQRFNSLTVLNQRSTKKILHTSVNFHPSDRLSDKDMAKIAREFMKAIDFDKQPSLVYRHIDAGHPHMHIVSTNIRRDGSRILNDLRDPHNLIRICADIERKYDLAHALTPPIYFSPQERYIPSLTYGKIPTRTGIEMVVGYVQEKYKFTTFDNFNAVLSLYNVRADRGNPDGRMYESRGLYYRLIDKEGKKQGAPIKASDLHLGATLNGIEERCKLTLTQSLHQERDSLRVHIKFNLLSVKSLGEFAEKLARDRVRLIIPAFTRRPMRGDKHPDTPGLFYVDFKSMTVFRDTELGPDYTAPTILRHIGLDKAIPELAQKTGLELKPGEKALLDNPDLEQARTRDLILRLSIHHDQWIKNQQEQQRQVRRLTRRLGPGW